MVSALRASAAILLVLAFGSTGASAIPEANVLAALPGGSLGDVGAQSSVPVHVLEASQDEDALFLEADPVSAPSLLLPALDFVAPPSDPLAPLTETTTL